jgi:hypothetical protein
VALGEGMQKVWEVEGWVEVGEVVGGGGGGGGGGRGGGGGGARGVVATAGLHR